jgi:hypothetical protein
MLEFQNFLNLVLMSLAPILATIVAGAIVAAVKGFLRKLNTELGASQHQLLLDIVRTAVLYAEQSGLTGVIEKAGEEKKREAINFTVRQLDKYGLSHVNVDEISRLIEAAVQDVFNRERLNIMTVISEPEEVIPSPDDDK